MISGLSEMSYEDFKETLLVLSEDFDCEIPFIPEPEMVKAVLGYVEDEEGVALAYSVEKILEVLMDRDEMTEEEAMEYYSYNIVRGALYSSLKILFVY
jgi:hypothetical protein